jgi:hypothetical protein
MSQNNSHELSKAVKAALAGDWQTAHEIAQEYNDATANWIHAVLHKIEGDKFNSNYWYAKTNGKKFEDFNDAQQELIAIQTSISKESD